ncbi:thioester domain-containing protein [Nocardioides sp. AE5]|uniref:thioester domain-containing protein n=1 Tax=Nocardioides sp. AE5 TaxID=2962573 RepID=UPI00288257CD|nr:thioester domain-containing protein [Nocardioides sp. AE5]MDT0202343.1 thioester domain-containing protein [Nocardioides sp. AE5]
MKKTNVFQLVRIGASSTLVGAALVLGGQGLAQADMPPTPVAEFQAPECVGETDFDPTVNSEAVPDSTLVFGARVTSYNGGHIVPLYDAFGGTVLVRGDGTVSDEEAYPPICGTRYVASVGGPVSEWMFCTDRTSQSCGDTDAAGNVVDGDGVILNPMASLAGNPRLSSDQERLIAYLIQNGHPYHGTGDQAWGGVDEARADAGTRERVALQTLIWCISDPAPGGSDFSTTCADNMDTAEQERLLRMIPMDPELVLDLDAASTALEVGDTARFRLRTNVFHQPIALTTGGTAAPVWSVCEGDATISASGDELTVAGEDPLSAKDVVLCVEATAPGTATVEMTASPATTSHIGWSQSSGATADPCQVYATFHEVKRAGVSDAAEAAFTAASKPTAPTGPTEPTGTPQPTSAPNQPALPNVGGPNSLGLGLGVGLTVLGAAALLVGRRRNWAEQ